MKFSDFIYISVYLCGLPIQKMSSNTGMQCTLISIYWFIPPERLANVSPIFLCLSITLLGPSSFIAFSMIFLNCLFFGAHFIARHISCLIWMNLIAVSVTSSRPLIYLSLIPPLLDTTTRTMLTLKVLTVANP